MSLFHTLDDLNPDNKTILVRADLNVPMHNGHVTDTTRIDRLMPTIHELISKGAKIILMTHLGRPKKPDKIHSVKNLLPVLTKFFGKPPLLAPDSIGEETKKMAKRLKMGEILLLENLRFHKWEEMNGPHFAQSLAELGDFYVNDAFSCSHRAHASIVAITHFLPSYAGRGFEAELKALSKVITNPTPPVMAIVAGSKISTKLDLLTNLITKIDKLVIGGGMANTFIKAQGYSIGQSLCEDDMLGTAKAILDKAKSLKCDIILPIDVVVTKEIKPHVDRHSVPLTDIQTMDIIVDLGDKTIDMICDQLAHCSTVVWNGPVGIFEIPPFDQATTALAKAISTLTTEGKLISVAGGGDTLAAIAHAKCADGFTYTSTAGGAFLEWLEGKVLPGIEALELAAARPASHRSRKFSYLNLKT